MGQERQQQQAAGAPLVTAVNLQKTYYVGETRIPAVRKISLKIAAGDFVAITGPSGSGKSTLLHLLAGLDQADAGQIWIDGWPLHTMGQGQLIRFRLWHVGFVFQSFHLLPYYTVLENVALPLAFGGISKKNRNQLAGQMLRLVGLQHLAERKPSQLSGGQQQRVGIARALVGRPQILFADEPTGNLDSNSGREILQLFLRLRESCDTTIVMVTHDQTMAQYADRRIAILDGKIGEGGNA